MPADAPSPPKDVADMLEALARRLRTDPRATLGQEPPAPGAMPVEVEEQDDAPDLGAVDVFSDGTHLTVTVETRNADPAAVQVSLVENRLQIGLGPDACKREVPLPAPVEEGGCFATLRNGVLDVVLPLKRAG